MPLNTHIFFENSIKHFLKWIFALHDLRFLNIIIDLQIQFNFGKRITHFGFNSFHFRNLSYIYLAKFYFWIEAWNDLF